MPSALGIRNIANQLTVVGSVLLARDHCLGVEERAEGARLDLIDRTGFQVDVQATGDILARASLREERAVADVVTTSVLDATVGLLIASVLIFSRYLG